MKAKKVKAKPTPSIRRPKIKNKDNKASVRPPTVGDRKIASFSDSHERGANIETSSPDGALEALTEAVVNVQIDDVESPPKLACRFHPGRVFQKVFTLRCRPVSETYKKV